MVSVATTDNMHVDDISVNGALPEPILAISLATLRPLIASHSPGNAIHFQV
jgi:hypothetical protein